MQVTIKLLHPIFGKFEHLAGTVQPTAASLQFVQTICAQAKYYYASEEKDYQPVMRTLWKDLLLQLGGVSRPAVGRNSVPNLALAVSIPHVNLCLFDQACRRVIWCIRTSAPCTGWPNCRRRMDWF